MKKKNEILFIFPTNIGDFILATPLLSYFKKLYPDAHFHILGGKIPLKLVKYHPIIKKTYISENYKGKKYLNLFFKWIKMDWTAIIDVKHTLFPFVLRTKRRFFKLKNNNDLHALYDYLRILKKPIKDIEYFLFIPQKNEKNAHNLLKNIPKNSYLIGINPDANWDKKIWPKNYFLELIDIIKKKKKNTFFIITGLKKYLQPLPKDSIDLSGKTDINTLAAIIKRLNFFISNDSGPMHLSSALSTKTLGIFGPSLPKRYKPLGKNAYYIKNTSFCEKCYIDKCPYNFICLKKLTPKIVFSKIEPFL